MISWLHIGERRLFLSFHLVFPLMRLAFLFLLFHLCLFGFGELTLDIETFDAFDDCRIVFRFHVGGQTIQNVNVALKYNGCIEMFRDICGDDNRFRSVNALQYLRKLALEMVGIRSKAAEEIEFLAISLLLFDPITFFILGCLHLPRKVIGAVSKEKDLLIEEALMVEFQIISNFKVGDWFCQILFSLRITHDLIELLELESASAHNELNRLDHLRHQQGRIDRFQIFMMKGGFACQEVSQSTGDISAHASADAHLAHQLNHLRRILVNDQRFRNLHACLYYITNLLIRSSCESTYALHKLNQQIPLSQPQTEIYHSK